MNELEKLYKNDTAWTENTIVTWWKWMTRVSNDIIELMFYIEKST